MEYAAVCIAFVHRILLKMRIYQETKMLAKDNEFSSEVSESHNTKKNDAGSRKEREMKGKRSSKRS
jgi:hypothetical protein